MYNLKEKKSTSLSVRSTQFNSQDAVGTQFPFPGCLPIPFWPLQG